jgi:hypothetical protein
VAAKEGGDRRTSVDPEQDRERGHSQNLPSHGPSGSLAGASSVASDGPESSRDCSSRGIARGVCAKVCQECRQVVGTEEVADNDPRSGKADHVVCAVCRPAAVRRWREDLQLLLECEGCAGISLEIDGVCPICHVGHDGPRCANCGRYAYHREDCPTMQPPPVQDLLDQRQVMPAVVEKSPPADAGHDWALTRAFLVGLGLWPLFVALFMPYALIAAQVGAR